MWAFLLSQQDGSWAADKVVAIPPKKVENWVLPEMPGDSYYVLCCTSISSPRVKGKLI